MVTAEGKRQAQKRRKCVARTGGFWAVLEQKLAISAFFTSNASAFNVVRGKGGRGGVVGGINRAGLGRIELARRFGMKAHKPIVRR